MSTPSREGARHSHQPLLVAVGAVGHPGGDCADRSGLRLALLLGLPLTYLTGGAAAFGWLALGAIAAGFLRARRRPGSFTALGRVFAVKGTVGNGR
jgi:hypothetical protein